MPVDESKITALMLAFDDLTVQCQRVENALPQQMTAAIVELERSRKAFRELFNAHMVALFGRGRLPGLPGRPGSPGRYVK